MGGGLKEGQNSYFKQQELRKALSSSFLMHGSMDSSGIITSVYGVQLIKHRMYHLQRSN